MTGASLKNIWYDTRKQLLSKNLSNAVIVTNDLLIFFLEDYQIIILGRNPINAETMTKQILVNMK